MRIILMTAIAMLATQACVIGAEDESELDAQEASNRPNSNGCGDGEYISSCMKRKGLSTMQFVCGFQRRVEGALFQLRWTHEAYDTNIWQYEKRVPQLEPLALGSGVPVLTIAQACGAAPPPGFRHVPGKVTTIIPTPAGCAQFGGRWNGTYCQK